MEGSVEKKSRQRRGISPVSVDPCASSPLSSCYDSLLSESQNSSLSDLSGEGYSSLSSSSGVRSGDESRVHYGAVSVDRSMKQAVQREPRGNGSEVGWRKTVCKPSSKTTAGSNRCRKQGPTQRGRSVEDGPVEDGPVDAGTLLNELVSSVTRRMVRVGSQRANSTSSGDDDADANEEGFENNADGVWRDPHNMNHNRTDSRPPVMRVPRNESVNGLPSPTLTVSSSVHARILPAPQRMKPAPLYTAPPGKRILSHKPAGHQTERHPSLTTSTSYSTHNGSGSDSGTASARGINRKSGVPSSHVALTTQWLSDNFETCDSRISISREKFFYHYQEFAASTAQKLMNQASFGKLLRSLFHLSTRRLGVRGHSKYHYSGIKVKDASPLKCIAEEIEVESMDFRFSSIPHHRPSIRPKKATGDTSLKPKPPSLNLVHPLASHKRHDGTGFHGPYATFSLSTGGWQQPQQPIPLAPLAATSSNPVSHNVDDGPTASRYLPPLSVLPPKAAPESTFDIQQVLQSPFPDSVPPMYPPDSVVLPSFASSRALGKPNAALAEEASGFLGAYQDHCQNMINIFYGPRPGDLPALVRTFWSRVAVAASPLFWQEDVLWDIIMADLTVYSTLLNELDKDPLHPSAVGRLAYLVYNLSDWTNSVGQGTIPSYLFEVKNEACRALRDAFNESAATANATVELQCVLDDENQYEALRDRWNRLSFWDLRREILGLLKPPPTTTASKFSLCLEVPKGGRRAVLSTSGQKGGRLTSKRHSSATAATSDATAKKRKRSVNKSKHEAYLFADESNSDRRLNRAINLPSEDELTCLILSHKHDKEEEEAVRRPFAPFLRQPSLRSARKSQTADDQRPTDPVPCSEDSTNLDGYAAGTDTDAETETDGENEKVKSAPTSMSEHQKGKMNERILESVEKVIGELIARKAAMREWFEMLDELLRECIPLSPALSQSDYVQRATHFLRQMSVVLHQIDRQQGDVSENEIRPLHVLITFLENGTIDRIRRRFFRTKVHWYEEQINREIARIINPSLSIALDRNGFFATATNAASLAQCATKTSQTNNDTTRDTPTGLRLSVITGECDPLLSAGNSFPPGVSHYTNGLVPPSEQYNHFSPRTTSSYTSDGRNMVPNCESYLDSVMKDADARNHMTMDGQGRLLIQHDEMGEIFRYTGASQMLESNELEAMTIAEGPKFTFSQYSPRQKDIFGMVPDRSSLSKIILPFRLSTT